MPTDALHVFSSLFSLCFSLEGVFFFFFFFFSSPMAFGSSQVGTESELQLWQCQILNPLCPANDGTSYSETMSGPQPAATQQELRVFFFFFFKPNVSNLSPAPQLLEHEGLSHNNCSNGWTVHSITGVISVTSMDGFTVLRCWRHFPVSLLASQTLTGCKTR